MRIRIVGDHGGCHCGSAAGIRALGALLAPHEIVAEDADFDLLVVNGQGSMHHDRPQGLEKLDLMAAAQALGRATLLVNTVWQDNGPAHDAVLARAAAVLTRGPLSSADLRRRHGIEAAHHLDLAWFAATAPVDPVTDFAGRTVMTDLWSPEWGGFVRPTSGPLAELPVFDLASCSWDQAIATLRTAGLVVTGRHHAVYAACKARVPFVPIAASSHKMEDLLAAAPVRIPVCRTQAEIAAFARHALAQRGIFAALFDWMEQQPPPDLRGLVAALPGGAPSGARAAPAHDARRAALLEGRAAYLCGRMAEASDRLRAARALGARFDVRMLIVNAMRGGRGWVAAEAFAEAVLGGPPRPDLAALIADLGADRAGWHDPDPAGEAPPWWRLAQAAGRAAEAGAVDESRVLADAALEAASPAPREAARTALLARAFQLWRVGLADHLHAALERGSLPGWFLRCSDLHYAARRRVYAPAALAAARAALGNPGDLDERLLGLILDQLWSGQGADVALLEAVLAILAQNPPFRAILPLRAASLAVALGQDSLARALVQRHGVAAETAGQCLALAAALGLPGPAALRRLWHDRAASEARLCARLADPRLALAIVGNGPLARPGQGAEIDAHDIVIRFNDFVLNDEVGRRVDLNLTVLHREPAFRQPLLSQARHGSVLMQPLMPWLSHSWQQVGVLAGMGHPLAFLPDLARHGLQQQLGHPPSSGLQAAGLVAALRGGVRNVRVFGMPLLQRGSGDERIPGGRAHERHDWDGERRVFALLGFPGEADG